MNNFLPVIIDLAIIILLIIGIRFFRTPKGARAGNLIAAFTVLCALMLVLYRNKIINMEIVIVSLIIGSLIGGIIAMRVNMIQIPAMVAFQHGAGGIAAFLISFVELVRGAGAITLLGMVSGFLGLIIGAFTFSGSMVASGKLANKLTQTPVLFKKHNLVIFGNIAAVIILTIISALSPSMLMKYYLLVLILLSISLGIIFSVRIGGADMPVLISFLNATAGLAAAFCGIVIQNRLLIACGATVAASGSILTHVMCKAMNRSLLNVFVSIKLKTNLAQKKDTAYTESSPLLNRDDTVPEVSSEDPFSKAGDALKNSEKVVIIPGYGMAIAQAQFKVVELAGLLEKMRKDVKFAIHPVAGRMPGHMNVLLAEAEVDYEKLIEMDDINPEFKGTDTTLVVGACDVVNPAAIEKEDTPISGMPILMAHESKAVVVCNLDERPGYSGVENSLYKNNNTIMLLGDANDTLNKLLDVLVK